jgi:flagellin
MALSIKTNISSLEAQKNLMSTTSELSKSLGKLSSGYRITKVRNANDALNVTQTAESSMNETQNILTRLRELASQSASSGVSNTERGYIQNEVTALVSEVDRIANATEYNGVALLNASTALTFQVGIRNVAANDQIVVNTSSVTAATLGVSGLSLSTLTGAQGALSTIDAAMQSISSTRATLGAQANRMEKVINTATTAAVALSAAQSRIQDVDVAAETSNLSRSQILMQAGVSVLAQANQMAQVALKLLG